MGAGKPLKREFFNSASEGGKTRGRCEKTQSCESESLDTVRASKAAMGAPKPLKREFFVSAQEGGKARGRGEKAAVLRVGILRYGSELRKLLWERESSEREFFNSAPEGGRARGRGAKSAAKLRLCPFRRRAPPPGADAAFVPRIGRAPFSGCAANAKKPCGSTPLR